MTNFTGFKHTVVKSKQLTHLGTFAWQGRSTCFENGRKLWHTTSKVHRLSKADALNDAENITSDIIGISIVEDKS